MTSVIATTADNSEVVTSSRTVKVWDWPVRVTHWGFVICFVGAYVTNRLGVNYFLYHAWFGYTALVLAAFRILWGVFGTRHARFTSFVRGPIATLRYAGRWLQGQAHPHAGHNPLGAWMVIALLLAMLFQSVTGLFANDDVFNFGPLYGYVSNDYSLQLTSWHRQFFYWIAGAVAIHVVAVLIHVSIKKEPLIRAMLTGHKPARDAASSDVRALLTRRRGLLAVVLAALCVAALVFVIATAPDAQMSFD